MYKMIIAIRSDIKMGRGKAAAQAAHAATSVLDNANKKIISAWKREGQKKIIVKVKSEDDLILLQKKCKDLKIPCAIIHDAGLTEIAQGTATSIGIGPEREEKINKVTGSLPLLK